MGVVNITPDSFSDGGLFLDSEAAVAHGLRLLDEGADLLDLGAESTRPGTIVGTQQSTPPAVSAEVEQTRLLPVLKGILKTRPDAVISVDTYKSATARAALAAGAEIINDVSGFTWDQEMAGVCALARCGVVLMHTRGRPDQWRTQEKLAPDALLELVRAGLAASLDLARAAGIAPDSIVLDPGYGFGKKFDERITRCSRDRQNCFPSGARCSPESRENPSWDTHLRIYMGARPCPPTRERQPALQQWLLRLSRGLRSCACTACSPQSRQRD